MSIASDERSSSVRTLLKRYHLSPSKGLGQNLLAEPAYYQRIVDAAELEAQDIVLEIGPGLGTLTRMLAGRVKRVTAVELDHRMVEVLDAELAGAANVRIVEDDILQVDIPAMLASTTGEDVRAAGYKVVANLPYYITSAALRHILSARMRPARMVLMVQWEVAERLTAVPGKLSLLGVSVQVYGAASIVCKVPASAFYPAPKVDSAVVLVKSYDEPLIPEVYLPTFFQLARAGFGQKRKQLHNSLTANTRLSREAILLALEQAQITPSRRAETLTLAEWRALCLAWPAAQDPGPAQESGNDG
ncbi:MAG: 16S rRNA (adenine(1518)-N(6)/adenine(1519)-N(6))-dimethyltransferase RsmA [Chloroflexi bacterium]|nr:16S rRNA (adenine(1518)-N(6)/adenine(1519)-N(6))-dimethyltransferase RsmA [Chloroflexota bacterium]